MLTKSMGVAELKYRASIWGDKYSKLSQWTGTMGKGSVSTMNKIKLGHTSTLYFY